MKHFEKLESILQDVSREIIFLVGLVSVAGSLAASEIFGWQTFTLSTIQRVFMYPLPLVAGIGIVLKKNDLRKLILPLSTLGLLSSTFHFLIVLFDPTRGCGFALPCSAGLRYTVAGTSVRPVYLPLLALTAFTVMIVFAYRYEPKRY